ncbi:MAG: ATPase [Geobacteraceae bacterium GWC2_48_7]|nr:MAG: ATPase [Geobacteraceae bacterium GWC2_48_7]
MYQDFYGFTEKPFTITPNPDFIFLSRIHREAFAHLFYGIDSHAGFITLTGEVGTGKTTVLRTLLSQLDPEKYKSALIFNPCLSGVQLLASICREFGVEAEEKNIFGYLDALNLFLLERHSAGNTVVLVIDEAQNLAPDVLEQVRMISNLETERDKLIQIILAGQPELNDLLNRHDLRQLNQRITVRCRLVSMGLEDTGDYIRHRLKVSGCRVPGLFTANAIKKIFDYSQGVPRLINVVCEQALIMAWTKERVSITASMINHVISSSKPDAGRRRILGSIFDWLIAGR